MNRATLYSTTVPIQPACGNHEAGSNFLEYKLRHSGVAASSNSGTAMFYSFEVGLVHYLVFNSETYVAGGIADMLAFMKKDLAGVDRSATPWVVAYSHKLWWMDGTDFSSISGILQDGGVDVLYAGHWHCEWAREGVGRRLCLALGAPAHPSPALPPHYAAHPPPRL